MNYPEYVKKILDEIVKAGYEAFAVGGSVRDFLLKKESRDYDITTSALPEETAEIFQDYNVIKTGLKHGTVTVIVDRHPVEITTYRIDGDYRDSRRPNRVVFTRCLEEDLARRDFTVNAMAYNDERGLVDLFDGKGDLEQKLIRAVGEPSKRFEEDALRIMRAFRFCSKLDFDIEKNTLDAAESCRHGLLNISAERKSSELEGILLGQGAKKALLLMYQAKIFQVIAPMLTIDTSRLEAITTLPQSFACRMAFCLIGQKHSEEYISTLRLSNAVSSKIKKLISLSETVLDLSNAGKLRRFMSKCGDCFEDALTIRSALGENIDGIKERADKIKKQGDCLCLSQLKADGCDLAELGIRGKEVGGILSRLLELVLDDPTLNERKTLIEIVKEEKNL